MLQIRNKYTLDREWGEIYVDYKIGIDIYIYSGESLDLYKHPYDVHLVFTVSL